jgi:hypothetical protein
MNDEGLYERIADDLVQHKIDRVIGIGLNISKYLKFENETGLIQYRMNFIHQLKISFHDFGFLISGMR